jgi:hypothetical protein
LRWWTTSELTLTLLRRRAVLLSALLTLRGILLLLLLARRRRASGVGLRSSLEGERPSQYSIPNSQRAELHACEDEHILRRILVEGIQGFDCMAWGCKERDYTAQGYTVPAAVVGDHMRVVPPEEVVDSRLVAVVVRIVVAGRTAAAAVRTAAAAAAAVVVLQAIGTHSAGGAVGAAQGMASSKPVVAGSAQRLHRQQQGVLREAYRRRVESAVVVGFVVGCVISEKDGPRRCYEVGEGADDARTGQEKKWEE